MKYPKPEKLFNCLAENIKFANVDNYRQQLKGCPEVIFCEGKTTQQIIGIAKSLLSKGQNVLATRATKKIFKGLKHYFSTASYDDISGIITIYTKKTYAKKTYANKKLKKPSGRIPGKISGRMSGRISKKGNVLVLSAGTADIPVAEEAALTAEFLGRKVDRIYDVGVAGLHRLLTRISRIRKADAIVVAAGMDGALPSVVSGLAKVPVVAVPTSQGYGVNFNGISPLLTMLNSCSPGVAVVNIDNGFGAGYLAAIIAGKL